MEIGKRGEEKRTGRKQHVKMREVKLINIRRAQCSKRQDCRKRRKKNAWGKEKDR